MKKCSMCGKIKSLKEFQRERRNKDGRRSECASCSAIAAKEKYKDPVKRKKILVNAKAYYESDHGKAVRKAYRESDHGKAVRKAYYESDHGKTAKKVCSKAYYESDHGKAVQLAADRRRAQKPGFKEKVTTRAQARRNKDPEAYNKRRREQYKKNKDKAAAHDAVYYAVSTGKLTRPKTCSINDEFCEGPIQAHHEDYSKKLDVMWLCEYHHHELHRIRNGNNWVSNPEKHVGEL